MKKVLILASVASMIDQFNSLNIKLLQNIGYAVDVACNFKSGSTTSIERINQFKEELNNQAVTYYQIDFARNVFNIRQIVTAYTQLKRIFEKNAYQFIHCHSPIGGFLGRVLSHKYKVKVIYTAHGFHFFKGAPLINWLIYYPVERWMARYTDVLITINMEDYKRAQKFRAKQVKYIPGVGVDINKYQEHTIDKKAVLYSLGIPEDSPVLLSVGELNRNKNHRTIIRALPLLDCQNIHYIIAGSGNLRRSLQSLSSCLNVGDRVHLLGYRSDIMDLYKASDLFCFPSLREGLSVSLIEAMASGLPVICSSIRGNVDLVGNGLGGFLCKISDKNDYKRAINTLIKNHDLQRKIRTHNNSILTKYNVKNVEDTLSNIYLEI